MREATPTQPRPVTKLVFTGTGNEYFRIWIVNLLLTLLSLGIYSAWAKVRKTSYFRRNTRLGAHAFGYHADPKAILRGRIAALVLVTAYSWGFAFSKVAGFLTLALLCALGPWLFVRAQQFALSNTSFRGLRFGFRTDVGRAYRYLLPLLVLWWAPDVLAGSGVGPLAPLALGATLPWMHHRLKAYQHGNGTYGNRSFAFVPCLGAFYRIYLQAFALILGASTLALFLSMIVGSLVYKSDFMMIGTLMAIMMSLLLYVLAWPYYAARMQQVVWDHTVLDGLRFRTSIEPLVLGKLVARNVLLTLVTGGLYWPWAAIALARYRVECMQIESGHELALLASAVTAEPIGATGEGSMDSFGLDIGL